MTPELSDLMYEYDRKFSGDLDTIGAPTLTTKKFIRLLRTAIETDTPIDYEKEGWTTFTQEEIDRGAVI